MKVLAFDPGVGNMGWALLKVHPPKEKVTILKHGTLIGNRYLKTFSKDLRRKFKDNFLILLAYRDIINTLIDDTKPDEIVSEGVFAHKHIQAAFSLVRCVHIIRETSYGKLKKDVSLVAPMLTKRTLTGIHNASKEQIQEAIDKNKNIKIKDKTGLTEHSYDAIGHGYHYIQTILHPDKFYLNHKKIKKSRKKT